MKRHHLLPYPGSYTGDNNFGSVTPRGKNRYATSSIISSIRGAMSGIDIFPMRFIEKLEEFNNLRFEEYAE